MTDSLERVLVTKRVSDGPPAVPSATTPCDGCKQDVWLAFDTGYPLVMDGQPITVYCRPCAAERMRTEPSHGYGVMAGQDEVTIRTAYENLRKEADAPASEPAKREPDSDPA